MSGYGGYDWSSAEENRQRTLSRLRGELAALRQQRKALARAAAQAAKAGLAVTVPPDITANQNDERELEAAVATLRSDLARTEHSLADAWDTKYRTRTAVTVNQLPGTTATQEWQAARCTAASPAPPRPANTQDTEVLRELIATGHQLVERVSIRCEDEDIAHLRESLNKLAAATTAQTAQTFLFDLKTRTQSAVEHAKQRLARHAALAQVHALTDELDEPQRTHLRQWAGHVPDPAAPEVIRTVLAAVDRAHHARARAELVRALGEIMTDLKFDVGAEFITALTDMGGREAVVALPTHPGYGIRMVIDPQDRLFTTVVRSSKAAPEQQHELDTAAQTEACENLDAVVTAAADRGIGMRMFRRVSPGERPVPPVEPSLLAAKPATAAASAPRTRARERSATREVGHDRP